MMLRYGFLLKPVIKQRWKIQNNKTFKNTLGIADNAFYIICISVNIFCLYNVIILITIILQNILEKVN